MGTYKVKWRGALIGEIINPIPDMSYLEGSWVPYPNENAVHFTSLASTYVGKEIIADPSKGTRLELVIEDGNLLNALVISLKDDMLFLRLVFSDDAVQWLLANVE